MSEDRRIRAGAQLFILLKSSHHGRVLDTPPELPLTHKSQQPGSASAGSYRLTTPLLTAKNYFVSLPWEGQSRAPEATTVFGTCNSPPGKDLIEASPFDTAFEKNLY
jgi:hypothetical protein